MIASMLRHKVIPIRRKKIAVSLVALLSTLTYPVGVARATCTIQTSRLQQISEREILAIIDGKCIKKLASRDISPG